MLTIDRLKDFGANTAEGLGRCMNMEDFYLSLVKKATADNKTEKLRLQLYDRDINAAFETAHALKGMFANLSLDPLTRPISELTELLRGGDADVDECTALLKEAEKQLEALRSLCVD